MLKGTAVVVTAIAMIAFLLFLCFAIVKKPHKISNIAAAPDWTIVCTHYNEDTDWIKTMLDLGVKVIVYDCGKKALTLTHPLLQVRDKKGQKATLSGFYSYYHFCLHDYHNLTPHTLFLHGHDTAWHQRRQISSIYSDCKYITDTFPSIRYINVSDMIWSDWYSASEDGMYKRVHDSELMKILNDPPQEGLHEIACGQAYVHKQRIRSKPKMFWKMLHDYTLNSRFHDVDDYVLEGTFHRVMGEPWKRPSITKHIQEGVVGAYFFSEIDDLLKLIKYVNPNT